MKSLALISTAILAISAGVAMSAPLQSTDGNANYGCAWEKADNGNFLTIKGNCNGIPTITGGTSLETVTTVTKDENGTTTTVERVESEDRGGAVVDREIVDVSFEPAEETPTE